MHRKQKTNKQTKNKQKNNTTTSKQKTNKQKQSNENFENLWTQGPITVNCRLQALGLYNFVRGFGWAYKRRGVYSGGLISFEMSHSSVDRNTFLINL